MTHGPGGPATDLAVVTGASRGIGLAVAEELVRSCARVVMVARGGRALLDAAARLGANAAALACDLADAEAVERAAARIREEFGTPQIIVNNAGIFRLSTVEHTSVGDFTEALLVNLVGPFAIVRAFLPELHARRTGHIVTIGSIADHIALPSNASYAASKYGVRALHEVLRAELRGTGVRTTLISPAAVDTRLWDAIDHVSNPGLPARAAMLAPEAVAAAVAFAIGQPASVNVDELRLSRA